MRLGPVPVVLGLSATVVVTSVGCVKGSGVDVSSVTSAVDVSTSFELDVAPADDDGVAVVEDDGSSSVVDVACSSSVVDVACSVVVPCSGPGGVVV